MKIDSGLMDHAVLQQNKSGVSNTHVSGQSTTAGTLSVSVSQRGKSICRSRPMGRISAGRFTFDLDGIPVGGPYEVTLRLSEKSGATKLLAFSDLWVGDLWLVGGQSNMQGCGLLKGSPKAIPQVRAFYMDDHWGPAEDPIHNMWNTVDDVHVTLCGGRPGLNTVTGTGPAVSFGQAMFKATGIPQGLIASAHGGTSMAQWNPSLKKEGSKSLYGAMLRRLARNGGRVAGVIWYQGESDANPDACKIYTKVMSRFVQAIRRDAANPALPFLMVQISRVVGWGGNDATWWNSIQDQQRLLPRHIPHCLAVPAVDLPLVDPIHIDTEGQVVIGRRLAGAALTLTGQGRAKLPPPPTIRQITTTDGQLGSAGCIEITYDNIVGRLTSSGYPTGYSVLDQQGTDQVYRVRLSGNKATLDTAMGANALKQTRISYGRGHNPHCNVTDAAGRPVPVFGPHYLDLPRPSTSLATFYHVSKLLPSAGKLGALGYPRQKDSLELSRREAAGNFCRLHEAFAAVSPKDVHVIYAWKIFCSEPMRVGVSLGYDGPVKVWANGRTIFHDPNGTNPSTPGARMAPFRAKQGENELLIALASNFGAAWGVFLAVERLNVTRDQLMTLPHSFPMPELRPFA